MGKALENLKKVNEELVKSMPMVSEEEVAHAGMHEDKMHEHYEKGKALMGAKEGGGMGHIRLGDWHKKMIGACKGCKMAGPAEAQPSLSKAFPKPSASSYPELMPDAGLKGVHQPITPGSGHSKAGIIGTGAKHGSSDANAALKEHKRVLNEARGMKKPMLKGTESSLMCSEMKAGQSYRDMKKASNPDAKEDAQLGEKVERDVEAHMMANKEAEKKEGHKIMLKGGQSYRDLKKEDLTDGGVPSSDTLTQSEKASSSPKASGSPRPSPESYPELKRGMSLCDLKKDAPVTPSAPDSPSGPDPASAKAFEGGFNSGGPSASQAWSNLKNGLGLGKGVEMKAGMSLRDLKKAELGMAQEQFDKEGALKPQEISLDAEASRREGEAKKEKEALEREAKVSGERTSLESATVKDSMQKGAFEEINQPAPQPTSTPASDGSDKTINQQIGNPFGKSVGAGQSYRDLKKSDENLAEKNIKSKAQAIVTGIKEAKADKSMTKSQVRAEVLGQQISTLTEALNSFGARVGQPQAQVRDRFITRAAAGFDRPEPQALAPLIKNAPQAPTAAQLTAVGNRRIEAAAASGGPHGQSYSDFRRDAGE